MRHGLSPCDLILPAMLVSWLAMSPTTARAAMQSSLEGWDCDQGVYGWACDQADANRPLQILFFEDNDLAKLRGSVVADIAAETAVATACNNFNPPTGTRQYNHRFSWTLPESLRGGIHHLHAYAVDASNVAHDLGEVVPNCAASDTNPANIGLWDQNIADGTTQSDYGDAGCSGHADLALRNCAFLRKGSSQPQHESYPFGPVSRRTDTNHDFALFESCPTAATTCDPATNADSGWTNFGNAADPCPKEATLSYPSCNTYSSSGPFNASRNSWFIENNVESPGVPWASFLPTTWSCLLPPSPVGPPNKSLPIGGAGSGQLIQFWETTSACSGTQIVNLSVNLNATHPCVTSNSTAEMTPYVAWGTQRDHGNGGKPIGVFQYPPNSSVSLRKGIQFDFVASAGVSAADILHSRIALESYWNGKKRWVWVELARIGRAGGISASGLPQDQVTSLDWNWPLKASRLFPGAVIAYNPFAGTTSDATPIVPTVEVSLGTPHARSITINIEKAFQLAIDRRMDADWYYPGVPGLDRYQLGDKPANGTILYLNAVSFLVEGGRVGDAHPENPPVYSTLTTSISNLHTVDMN